MGIKKPLGVSHESDIAQPAGRVEHIKVLDEPVVQRDGDEINLRELFRLLLEHKATMLVALLIGLLVPALIYFLSSPVYRAETVIAAVPESGERNRLAASYELGSIAALAGISVPRGSRKSESIALLRSRALGEQFIREHDLAPRLVENARSETQAPERSSDISPADMAEAYRVFDEEIRLVQENHQNGLVVVAMDWEDPVEAARWSNALVGAVNELMRARATLESQQAIAYLQKEIEGTSAVELQKVLHRLIESEMKEIILANVREDYAFRVIDPAVAPVEPYRPMLVPMLVIGALLGLMCGIALSLLREVAKPARRR